ncbi:MAG: hypothetical protein ABW066_06765 [Sedimenticola sp.]
MKPNLPAHAKVTIMGLPFHGKVVGGQLTLPTSEIKTVAQPEASNTLLKKIATLPDRSASVLDQVNGYQWKDRLLLAGPTAMAISDTVYIASDDSAWIIRWAAASVAGGWQITATVLRRFGVISFDAPTDLNVLFYTSAVIPISSAEQTHLGMISLNGLDFAEQNPQGDKVLVGMRATYSDAGSGLSAGEALLAEVDRSLAGIQEVTITGTPDSAGNGLSASEATYKTLYECAGPGTEVLTNTKVFYQPGYQKTSTGVCTPASIIGQTTCDFSVGYSFTKTITESTAFQEYAKDPSLTYSVARGDYTTESDQVAIRGAYYDEDGLAHFMGVRRKYRNNINYNYSYSYAYAYLQTKQVTTVGTCADADILTDTDWTLTETYEAQEFSTERWETAAQIDGVDKEELAVIYEIDWRRGFTKIDSDTTSVTDNGVHQAGGFTCTEHNDITDHYRDLWNDYNALGTTTQSEQIVVENNGGEIKRATYGGDVSTPIMRTLSNRLVACALNSGFADTLALGYHYGAHTDGTGISGPTDEYASYDPYSGQIATDPAPVGHI